MTTLQLVRESDNPIYDFWMKYPNQIAITKTVRILFLLVVLTSLVLIQVTQSEFINIESHLPVFAAITLSFFLHCIYMIFYDQFSQNRLINISYFVYDSVFITGLYYFTGYKPLSVFIFVSHKFNTDGDDLRAKRGDDTGPMDLLFV